MQRRRLLRRLRHSPSEATLTAMKVPQLKELCQQRSIVTKGLKKAELVWSLLSQPPPKQ